MKLAIAAVIIALQGGTGSVSPFSTEGLADLARQERERRQESDATATRVFTDENVIRTGTPIVVGRVGEVTPEETVVTGSGGEISVGLDDAAAAIAQQERVVRNLEDQEVRLQLDINRFRGEYLAPVVSQRERDRALAGMNAASTSLEGVRAQLAEARETLEALRLAAAEAADDAADASASNP